MLTDMSVTSTFTQLFYYTVKSTEFDRCLFALSSRQSHTSGNVASQTNVPDKGNEERLLVEEEKLGKNTNFKISRFISNIELHFPHPKRCDTAETY